MEAARPDPEPPERDGHTNPGREASTHFDSDDFFGLQPSSTEDLPDPVPFVQNLARRVIEVLAGARDIEQISRWVSDDVYMHILKRVVIATRARRAKNQSIVRPNFVVGNTFVCEPRDGVVETAIILEGKARTRVVAIRMEGLDGRWRATAIGVL